MDYHMIIASQYVTRQAMQNHTMDVDTFYAVQGADHFAFVGKFRNIIGQAAVRGQIFWRRLAMQKPDVKANV